MRQFARLLELIYAAADNPQAWGEATTAIADALKACATSFTIVDREARSAPFIVAPRTDPEWIEVYSDRWSVSNPLRERGLALPAGAMYDFESLGVPRPTFDGTPFYNEFLRPQGLNFGLIMLTVRTRTALGAIGVYRSAEQGRFDQSDARLMRELGPHLRRAVELNLRLAHLETFGEGAVGLLDRLQQGALLADRRGRILFANLAARNLLDKNTAFSVSQGDLGEHIAAALATIATGTGTPAGDRLKPLAVDVVPLPDAAHGLPGRPAAMVFLKPPGEGPLPTTEQIQALLDVTPAQAALAREMLHGDGIPAVAARLGISRSTARTHLLELFRKTGTNRQAELVRLILQQRPSPAATGAPEPRRRPAAKRGGRITLLGAIAVSAAEIGDRLAALLS